MTALHGPFFMDWTKVQDLEDCWLWTGGVDAYGYGQMSTRFGGSRKAHRRAYEAHYGSVPDGLDVCHSCDRRRCVNPWHLWTGTNADNQRDKVAKGRQLAGERIRQARLTVEQVRELRVIYATTDVSQRQLAARYGVTQATVSRAVRGESWAAAGFDEGSTARFAHVQLDPANVIEARSTIRLHVGSVPVVVAYRRKRLTVAPRIRRAG